MAEKSVMTFLLLIRRGDDGGRTSRACPTNMPEVCNHITF